MHDELARKISALDQLRGTFPNEWVDAQIAALRAAPAPEVQQRIEAETASGNVQRSAGNDALVLREQWEQRPAGRGGAPAPRADLARGDPAGGRASGGEQPRQAQAIGWALLEADPEGSAGFYRSAVLG